MVQFDDMSIPILINDLAEWSRKKQSDKSELSDWLSLLDNKSKSRLVKLFKASLLKDTSMARQLMRSWAGRELVDELSDFVRLDDDRSGTKVLSTLESLLEEQPQVNTIDLLEALPAKNIYLDLDGLLQLAEQWRIALVEQKKLVLALGKLATEERRYLNIFKKDHKPKLTSSVLIPLKVPHRINPLLLELWLPNKTKTDRSSWIIFMPGLGGSQDHFRWIAKKLSMNGWPVVLLEHPGSDEKAVKELLEGKNVLPGAEVLPDRLADLNSVVRLHNKGGLDIQGKDLILMGHSLGSLTAFLASGALPQDGLDKRCEKALDDLSLTNLSQLLQCQLVDVELETQMKIPDLKAIIAMNSFGSLLWPNEGDAEISLPVLLLGGTIDLITPPIQEQLGLLLSTTPHKLSRVLLVEGASHFSPVRVEGQDKRERGNDLLQLDDVLVGVQPLYVQHLFSLEIIRFLELLERGQGLASSVHEQNGDLRLHLMDRKAVNNLLIN